jgi:type III secretory pathway component EscU
MDYLKYAIRKKYIASAKSYLVLKVLILWDTDVVFRVKLISTLLSLIILKNITKFMELPLCGKAIAVD